MVTLTNEQIEAKKQQLKKTIMTLAAVLCCAMTMTVFSACSSDDDNNKDNKDDKTPAKVAMTLSTPLRTCLITARRLFITTMVTSQDFLF